MRFDYWNRINKILLTNFTQSKSPRISNVDSITDGLFKVNGSFFIVDDGKSQNTNSKCLNPLGSVYRELTVVGITTFTDFIKSVKKFLVRAERRGWCQEDHRRSRVQIQHPKSWKVMMVISIARVYICI